MKRGKPTTIERALSKFAPKAATRRYLARTAFEMLAGSVPTTAGGNKGTTANWQVRLLGRTEQARERQAIQKRARDLTANDAHAASLADSMALNTVGTGLQPQAQPHKSLGLDEAAAKNFADQAELIWKKWAKRADASGRFDFDAIQHLCALRLVTDGEFFVMPTMVEPEPGRDLRLALQPVDSMRVLTPPGQMTNDKVNDGIILGPGNRPLLYYVAEPPDGNLARVATCNKFREVPARVGHRPGMMHGFIWKEADQVRGTSALAPAMKLYKDLSDYLDFELVGAIVAASFPVFIEQPTTGALPGTQFGKTPNAAPPTEVSPGQILTGLPGQKPHILKSERPSGTFPAFTEILLRAAGAASGQPYERIAKDFSKTNYSSARAALLEAWKVDSFYRMFVRGMLCQRTYEMVMEEAYLRGQLVLPKGAPGFYEAFDAWCAALWLPPARGSIDPLKEMQANILGLASSILTLADIAAGDGSDWEAKVTQRGREIKTCEQEGVPVNLSTSKPTASSVSEDSNADDQQE